MTQENKQLLLQDLCARLPYGVKVEVIWKEKLTDVDGYEGKLTSTTIMLIEDDEVICRPYLRPMSSMTEEEKKELGNYAAAVLIASQNKDPLFQLTREALVGDFFNKHHIDYRGLIEKGLALVAPKNMY